MTYTPLCLTVGLATWWRRLARPEQRSRLRVVERVWIGFIVASE